MRLATLTLISLIGCAGEAGVLPPSGDQDSGPMAVDAGVDAGECAGVDCGGGDYKKCIEMAGTAIQNSQSCPWVDDAGLFECGDGGYNPDPTQFYACAKSCLALVNAAGAACYQCCP